MIPLFKKRVMFKGHCFPKSTILHGVYLKCRFGLSYRDIEELIKIRGVEVDHATIQRWVYKFTPEIEHRIRNRKHKVGLSWRMDETYIKVKGEDRYLYRAVDKEGNTVDFLLTKRRMKGSAQKFLNKAIGNNGLPKVINIDKSGANTEGIKTYNKRNYSTRKIKIRQSKYLNNIVEQDHRHVKWKIQRGLGFKEFESAQRTLAGMEIVHMIKKNQIIDSKSTWFETFKSLAA